MRAVGIMLDALSELLTQYEVELAATLLSKDLVEAVCPVDTHHTHHWQEETNTDTSRTFHFERIEILCFMPCITCLQESQTVDSGVTQQERIT